MNTPILFKYSLSYCQYKYQNSGIIPLVFPYEYLKMMKITGIKNNEPHLLSTFPDFNEKISNPEHYEQIIHDLEKTYTTDAIKNNHIIKITKTITPDIVNYKNNEYDLSKYEFNVTITKNICY